MLKGIYTISTSRLERAYGNTPVMSTTSKNHPNVTLLSENLSISNMALFHDGCTGGPERLLLPQFSTHLRVKESV